MAHDERRLLKPKEDKNRSAAFSADIQIDSSRSGAPIWDHHCQIADPRDLAEARFRQLSLRKIGSHTARHVEWANIGPHISALSLPNTPGFPRARVRPSSSSAHALLVREKTPEEALELVRSMIKWQGCLAFGGHQREE